MEKEEKPNENLIQPKERSKRVALRSAEIDKRAYKVEERKHVLGDIFIEQENNSVPISDDIILLWQEFIPLIEKRKELKIQWDKLIKQQNKIYDYCEAVEKSIPNFYSIQPTIQQKVKIEAMIAQYEHVITGLEQVLLRREEILFREEQIVSEIENKLPQ